MVTFPWQVSLAKKFAIPMLILASARVKLCTSYRVSAGMFCSVFLKRFSEDHFEGQKFGVISAIFGHFCKIDYWVLFSVT